MELGSYNTQINGIRLLFLAFSPKTKRYSNKRGTIRDMLLGLNARNNSVISLIFSL